MAFIWSPSGGTLICGCIRACEIREGAVGKLTVGFLGAIQWAQSQETMQRAGRNDDGVGQEREVTAAELRVW